MIASICKYNPELISAIIARQRRDADDAWMMCKNDSAQKMTINRDRSSDIADRKCKFNDRLAARMVRYVYDLCVHHRTVPSRTTVVMYSTRMVLLVLHVLQL